MNSKCQRLLVILTAGVGDVVDTLLTLRALKAAWPGIEIGVLVCSSLASPPAGFIDRIFVFTRTDGGRDMVNLLRSVRRFLSLLKKSSVRRFSKCAFFRVTEPA